MIKNNSNDHYPDDELNEDEEINPDMYDRTIPGNPGYEEWVREQVSIQQEYGGTNGPFSTDEDYRCGNKFKKYRKIFEQKNPYLDLAVEFSNRMQGGVKTAQDNIYRWEAGRRIPNPETRKIIKDVLGVSEYALMDYNLSDPMAVMYALFDMEQDFGLNLRENSDGSVVLSFKEHDPNGAIINLLLKEWFKNKKKLMEPAYSEWKGKFEETVLHYDEENDQNELRIPYYKACTSNELNYLKDVSAGFIRKRKNGK